MLLNMNSKETMIITQPTPYKKSIWICVFSSCLILLSYAFSSYLFMIAAIILVLGGIIFDRLENKLIYLLYFVNWSTIFKFGENQFSVFTILTAAFIIILVISLIYRKNKDSNICLVLFILVMIFTVANYNYNQSITHLISFIADIAIVLLVSYYYDNSYFERYVYTYAIGIQTSVFAGLLATIIPSIEIYLRIVKLNSGNIDLKRFSGLDTDPNYYALQIIMSICFLMVLILLKKNKKEHRTSTIILIFTLCISGFLSISKMYLISLVITSLLYFFYLFKKSIASGFKSLLIVVIVCGTGLIFGFNYLYNAYIYRFTAYTNYGSNINDITTGRAQLWQQYFKYIISSPKILFLGDGINAEFYNNVASHNFYLISIYYVGLVGCFLLIVYFVYIYKILKRKTDLSAGTKTGNALPLIVFLIVVFSLDCFGTDYITLQIMLIIFSLVYYEKVKISEITV